MAQDTIASPQHQRPPAAATANMLTCNFLVSKKEFSRVLRDSYHRLKDRRGVVAWFRRCGLYPLDPTAIDWSRVMPSRPRRGTSLPPLPTPSASSWARPDATHPIQPPLSPVAPPLSPLSTGHPSLPTPAPPSPDPSTQNTPPPQPPHP